MIPDLVGQLHALVQPLFFSERHAAWRFLEWTARTRLGAAVAWPELLFHIAQSDVDALKAKIAVGFTDGEKDRCMTDW